MRRTGDGSATRFVGMTRAAGPPEPLPIDDVLPALRAALASRSAAVLQAAPGAGKTTRVPLALMDATWLAGARIVMLEPRRLATRAAARRMAHTLGEPAGGTVGFRVRGETRVSRSTRIEVVTEGVLTRLLRADPTLDGLGLVIFDEFHERSLQGDVGLALALQTQELLRPDLRILVMSATLDGAATSALLGEAPVITSEGRQYPIEIRYLPRRGDQRLEGAVAAAVRASIGRDEGSVLAFLPGSGEIRRTHALLDESLPGDVAILPLYGDLSAEAQDAAIAPAAAGSRKVVLATSIAETSLTIDGVRVVVDGGAARVSRFSPRSGMTRLETVRVSRASARQRSGRAGRTASGISYRLWAAEEEGGLLERATPEILEADLAPLALDLAAAGVTDPRSLRWLDLPPAGALSQARELLRQLGALDAGLRITAHGRAMSEVAVHPRLAHMLLRGRELECGATACVLAALLEERDVLRREGPLSEPDLRPRLAAVAGDGGAHAHAVDRDAVRRVREQSRQLRSRLGVRGAEPLYEDAAGGLLALAYPDRIAQRRPGGGDRYLLRNGLGAALRDPGALSGSPFLVIADLDGQQRESRIYLAVPVGEEEVARLFAEQIERDERVDWDAASGSVVARRQERLGAIVLREGLAPARADDTAARVLLDALERDTSLQLRWTDDARTLQARVAFARTLDESWPDLGDATLGATRERWLAPYLAGLRRRGEVEALPLGDILRSMLTWQQRDALDRMAPTHFTAPTGSRLPVDYSDPAAPAVSVRLQEMFGLMDTPRVGEGRVPLTIHLLSPAHRPVQVTRDLAGFWRSSYFAVRKELRGRYPRHEWPEDPLAAAPTRRAKPR